MHGRAKLVSLLLTLCLVVPAHASEESLAEVDPTGPQVPRGSEGSASMAMEGADGFVQPALRGVIEPAQKLSLRSTVEAQVLAVHAKVGQTVNRDQVLVTFDTAKLDRDRKAADARYAQACAQLALAKSAVSRAREVEEQVRADLDRVEALAELSDRSRPSGLQGNHGADVNGIMRSPLRETIERKTDKALRLSQWRRAEAEALEQRATETLSLARTAKKLADEAVRRYGEVAAPFDGTLATCHVKPGDFVSVGKEIVTVVCNDRVKAVLWVPQGRVAQLNGTLSAWVCPDVSVNDWYLARRGRVVPLPEPRTSQFLAEFEIDNRHGELQPGLFVTALVTANDCSVRRWTDRAGQNTHLAELLSVRGGEVQLREAEGDVVTVPIDRLSDADREYLQSACTFRAHRGGGRLIVK